MTTDRIGSETFDSRDVDARIAQLEDIEERDEIEEEELGRLVAFREEVGDSEWKYGVTFIRDDYFQQYAQELAEDIGAINPDAPWPANCIDWEEAADQLKNDYSSVGLDGTIYWVRN